MITFDSNLFDYSGKTPITTWVNNVSGYEAELSFPNVNKDTGSYEEWVPVIFKKGENTIVCSVIRRYTISPINLIIRAEDKSREYGDYDNLFTLLYSGFVNNEDEQIFSTQPIAYTSATSKSDVGEYTINVIGGSAKNYTFVYEPGILTITKTPLSAKVNNTSRLYGQDNPTFTVEYTGLKNGERVPKWKSSLNIKTSATKQSDVGTYTITATGTPTNYDLPIIESGTLSITKAPLAIKANNATRKYFDEEPSFTYYCTGFVNDDDANVLTKAPSYNIDATKASNVGKYTITPYGAEAKNYAISYEHGALTITKRMLTASSHCSRLYGDENPLLPIEYNGFVNNETENVLSVKPVATTTAKKTSAVGDYPITLSGGEATNYDFNYQQGVLTITKASLSAKVKDATKVYGAQNPAFSIEYYGLRNGETVPAWTTTPSFETEATKVSGVGQYAVKAIKGVATNYNLEVADGTLSITPASLTIKSNNATRKYFEEDPSFTYYCIGFVNNDDVGVLTKAPSFSTDATMTSSVGKYTITPYGAEAKNYAISYEHGVLTITKRMLTASSHCSRLYGDENPILPIEYSGFVNNETENVLSVKPVATTTAKKTSAVGDYPITLSGGEATNYDFNYQQGVLTITKASLSAKVKDATKVYGAQNPAFSIEYYGLRNGETVPAWTTTPSFETEATKVSGVGQYVVKAVDGVPVNYELEISDGTLSITPAALTIIANNATRLYYDDNPAFSYQCSGFVNGDNETLLVTKPNLSTVAKKTSNVGSYEIIAEGAYTPNYSISYKKGTLSITPRTLAASVGNYERRYNEENPTFKVTYEGFVSNENEKSLTAQATANTSATSTSDVGTYMINVSGGEADNYMFTYYSGVLTITKAEQTIEWEQDMTHLKEGDQIELLATASSGLTVTYTSENSSIAEIYAVGNHYYLDCKSPGELWLIAQQNGNKNYYSSQRIRKKIVINDASAISPIQNSSTIIVGIPYGVRVINAKMSDKIFIYTTDGVLQKIVKVDNQIVDIPLIKHDIYIVRIGGKTVKIKY